MRHTGQDAFTIAMTLNEGRIVFEALAELPFKDVYELIGTMNRQTNESLTNGHDERMLLPYTVSRQELALMLRALGEMPFHRVVGLVQNLNAQIRQHAGNRPLGDEVVSYG